MPRRFRSRPTIRHRAKGYFWARICVMIPRSLLAIMGVVSLVLGILYLLDAKMKPVVLAASSTMAHRVGAQALTMALADVVQEQAGDDHLFTTVPASNHSQITMTRVDVSYLTKLQAAAGAEATERLNALSKQTIRLPLLSMYSGSLLSRSTWTIPVRIQLLGAVHTSIESDVMSKGVNQVVHIIWVREMAEVMVITPFVSRPTTVDAKSPVAYVVMSGPVPHT